MTRPVQRLAARLMPIWAAVLVAAAIALFAAPGGAQVAPSDTFAGTVSDYRRSAGIPAAESILCEGQRRDDRIGLNCRVHFDTPTEVVGAKIVEQPSGRDWVARRGIPLFRPLEAGQDDTAFFILVDSVNKIIRPMDPLVHKLSTLTPTPN